MPVERVDRIGEFAACDNGEVAGHGDGNACQSDGGAERGWNIVRVAEPGVEVACREGVACANRIDDVDLRRLLMPDVPGAIANNRSGAARGDDDQAAADLSRSCPAISSGSPVIPQIVPASP